MRSAEKGEKVMATMFSEASMGLNEPVIKDSGTRREFETGAVRDIEDVGYDTDFDPNNYAEVFWHDCGLDNMTKVY